MSDCKKTRRSNGYYYSDARRAENKRRKAARENKRIARIKARQDKLVKSGELVRVTKVNGKTKLIKREDVYSAREMHNRAVKALGHHLELNEAGVVVVLDGFREMVTSDLLDEACKKKFATA